MNAHTKTSKSIALLTVFAMLMFSFAFVIVGKVSASGITSMSITGTGITANSSAVTTAITPTINFTTPSALTLTGQTLQFILNGTTVVTGQTLTVANLTLTCSNGAQTLEAAPGTADNGIAAVTITNGASTNNNPVILVTLDTNTGAAPNCAAGAATLAVASGKLQSSSTASNYAIGIQTSLDNGSFFYYVGSENLVQINATVDNTLSFTIRNTADTADQANVGGLAVGPNLCDLGDLSVAGVQSCSYRLKISTNATSGYYASVVVNHGLQNAGATHTITNTASGSAPTGGTEGYNILLAAGSATTGTVTTCNGVITTGNCLADGIAWSNGTGTIFNNTSASTMFSVSGPNNPGSTDTTNTALVTHRAEADASTPAGTYTQLATYTINPRW